jgi:hypothetical protein
VAIAIFFAFYWGTNPQSQFSIFACFTVVFVAGFTTIEGLFFRESASEVSGYGDGGAYQRQSTFHFLALTVTIILAFLLGWGFFAYLGLFIFLMIFLTLSAINHLYSGLKEKFVFNSLLRPILTIFLWIIAIYFLLPALNSVK